MSLSSSWNEMCPLKRHKLEVRSLQKGVSKMDYTHQVISNYRINLLLRWLWWHFIICQGSWWKGTKEKAIKAPFFWTGHNLFNNVAEINLFSSSVYSSSSKTWFLVRLSLSWCEKYRSKLIFCFFFQSNRNILQSHFVVD